jgi:hypothetical protein
MLDDLIDYGVEWLLDQLSASLAIIAGMEPQPLPSAPRHIRRLIEKTRSTISTMGKAVLQIVDENRASKEYSYSSVLRYMNRYAQFKIYSPNGWDHRPIFSVAIITGAIYGAQAKTCRVQSVLGAGLWVAKDGFLLGPLNPESIQLRPTRTSYLPPPSPSHHFFIEPPLPYLPDSCHVYTFSTPTDASSLTSEFDGSPRTSWLDLSADSDSDTDAGSERDADSNNEKEQRRRDSRDLAEDDQCLACVFSLNRASANRC